jgi:hypothetical protein
MYTFITDKQIQAVSSRLLGRKLTEEELDTVYKSIDNAIDFIDLAECAIDCL